MKKVLIIDDDKEMCALLKRFFSGINYEAAYALSFEQGLKSLIRENPDIIILDIQIKKRSGLDLLEKIKHITPSISVIVVTALPDKETEKKALYLGADAYIHKPFSIKTIKALLPPEKL